MDVKKVVADIEKISESTPSILDGKGVVLATFTSIAEVGELTDIFKTAEHNFLLFELSPKSAGFNFLKKNIQKGLFGFLDTTDLADKDAKFMNEINMSSTTRNIITVGREKKAKENKLTKSDIDKMGKTAKRELFDKLIDNGVENLTDYDKEILQYLAE
jgi:hypothetical protein